MVMAHATAGSEVDAGMRFGYSGPVFGDAQRGCRDGMTYCTKVVQEHLDGQDRVAAATVHLYGGIRSGRIRVSGMATIRSSLKARLPF